MGKKRSPRIAPDDYRTRDELETMVRYRVPFYQKSHILGADGETARCGAPLVPEQEWWDRYRRFMEKNYDADPGELYWAIERRVESNWCKQCNGPDRSVDSRSFRMKTNRVPEQVPDKDLTPAQRLQRRRLNAAAQRVAKQLDAKIVTGE